jgi:ribosomal protein L7/L12
MAKRGWLGDALKNAAMYGPKVVMGVLRSLIAVAEKEQKKSAKPGRRQAAGGGPKIIARAEKKEKKAKPTRKRDYWTPKNYDGLPRPWSQPWREVVLIAVGKQKIAVINELRALTGLGLKEAKDLVEAAPTPIEDVVLRTDAAEQVKVRLEGAGASVELRPAYAGTDFMGWT